MRRCSFSQGGDTSTIGKISAGLTRQPRDFCWQINPDKDAPMNKPKISLGSWAFSFGPFSNAPWSFSQVLEFTAQAGYDGVEINGFRPHPHPETMTQPQSARSW